MIALVLVGLQVIVHVELVLVDSQKMMLVLMLVGLQVMMLLGG